MSESLVREQAVRMREQIAEDYSLDPQLFSDEGNSDMEDDDGIQPQDELIVELFFRYVVAAWQASNSEFSPGTVEFQNEAAYLLEEVQALSDEELEDDDQWFDAVETATDQLRELRLLEETEEAGEYLR